MAELLQTLSTKHLLGIKDLTKRDIQLIFETADTFKDVLNRPIKKVPSLRDITIANIFFENSSCITKKLSRLTVINSDVLKQLKDSTLRINNSGLL